MKSYSLFTGERPDVRFGLVLLQVFAESRGSVEGGSTRGAEVLRFT